MRPTFLLIFLLLCTSVLTAQSSEARLLDEFGQVPCGDMMGRLDMLVSEWLKNTDERIVVIYYSRRFRKSTRYGKNGKPDMTVLEYPHPEDGLNWAKGIPRYLAARLTNGNQPNSENKHLATKLGEKLVLVDGGYGEEMRSEIWIVPPSATEPTPKPLLRESDVRFGAKKPYTIPSYYHCYSRYE